MNYTQANCKLDMEPNPFEQSFSDVSPDKPDLATTTDITTQPETPVVAVAVAAGGDATKTTTTVLPPIASMSGRLATNNGWDAQSLRMGPLSPSMLEGPQNPVSTNAPIPAGYNAAIVDDGFPFPAENQPQAQQQSQQQQQQQAQQQHYHQGAHPQVNDQRYMAQRGPVPHAENPETYGNLHLLSQATNREMWVKRETEQKGLAPMQGHLQQQQQHPNVSNHYQQQQQQQQHHQQQGHYAPQQHQQHGPVQHRPPQHGQALPGMPGMVAAPQLPKNGVEPAFVRGVRRGKMTSEEISEDSDQSGHTIDGKSDSGKKRAATEEKMDDEEKRKNFLERNRQ
ncbi:hypothetical protein BG000_004554, partial [Podila horticola]